MRRLVAKGCHLQQASVRTLAALPSLHELDLQENPQLMVLGGLSSLRELRRLDVAECNLHNAHLVPLLASLPRLQHLALNGNPHLTVAVVEALAAGPAACSLQQLSTAGMQLEWEALLCLLTQVCRCGVGDWWLPARLSWMLRNQQLHPWLPAAPPVCCVGGAHSVGHQSARGPRGAAGRSRGCTRPAKDRVRTEWRCGATLLAWRAS